jgi:hypothetical protein
MSNTRAFPDCAIEKRAAVLRFLAVAFSLTAIASLVACGNMMQSSTGSGSTPIKTSGENSVPSVIVTPANITVVSGGTQQFVAQLENTAATEVQWYASIGSISSTGLYTAPSVTTQTPLVVKAVSLSGRINSAAVKATVIPVHKLAALQITTSSLAAATTGVAYSTALAGTGGDTPYQWTLTSGTLPTGVQINGTTGVLSGTPTKAGTFAFTIVLQDASGTQTTQAMSLPVSSNSSDSSNYDGPAELPLVYLQTSMSDTPAPGQTIAVPAGGNFQAALNKANCGDTITLQAGATFGGVFTFPQKACDDQHWVIVRTSTPDSSLPVEGTRMTPCYAGVASLPARPNFPCDSPVNVLAKLIFNAQTGSGPVVFASGANHYRLIGLEITRLAHTPIVYNLIAPANGVPASNIILDRLWVHGTAHDETQRGIYLAGVTSAAIIDSYFNDFHCVSITGSCMDSQAIGGGGGNYTAGPYKIVDDFLEASGENILFGGGAATTTPADIQIQQNHLFKPLIWMAGQPGYVGGSDGNPFIVKNNFELKNAQRVLFDGNIVEYSWGGFTQYGYSLVITPKNQEGDGVNLCPLCKVTDITIRYSTVSHAGAGINIANVLSGTGGAASAGERYSIHDITLDDINATAYNGFGPLVLVLNNWTANILNSVAINHITGIGDASFPLLGIGNFTSNPKMANFTFANSIVITGERPVWSSGGTSNCAYYDIPVVTFTACFAPYSFVKNALIGTPSEYPAAKWPASNYFPASPTVVQFTDYNNGNGGNYQLLSTSPYKNAGTDGMDLGANINLILTETANAY